MADPFLAAHRCSEPRTYTLAGNLFPVSLRDQVLRGEMLVHRLAADELIRPGEKVVVIGAGAAGVSAALCAALCHSCEVHLVDRKMILFSLQSTCATRYAHPTIYDFPANHWRADRYPSQANPNPIPTPTPWRLQWNSPSAANTLVASWSKQFEAAQANLPAAARLEFVAGANASGFRRRPSGFVGVDIDYTDPAFGPYPNSPVEASAVIWATGFGPERRYLRDRRLPGQAIPVSGSTWGYSFWGNDPYEQHNFGLAKTISPSIVISGSGDGALQDFLRIVVKSGPPGEPFDTRKLYDDLFGRGKLELTPRQWERLRDAADRQSRAQLWGCEYRHDHAPLHELHEEYVKIVDELHIGFKGKFRSAVAAVVKPKLPDLKMIYSCTHFAQGYPLNRLLVLVLKKYLDEKYGDEAFFLPGRRVKQISSADRGHACNRSDKECHGKLHHVYWEDRTLCSGPPAKPPGRMEANVLVLRHGADLTEVPEDRMPPLARQMLPYDPLR